MNPKWLDWAQRLQAIAQTGFHYQPHMFDRERYDKVLEIATEMMAQGSGADPAQVRALFEGQAGHATPKVDVRGVVFHQDTVLLVREGLDGGRWTLPGGWADIGEPPSVSAVREVYEESGYRARAVRLLALYDRNLHHPPSAFHSYKIFFQCELIDPEPDDDHAAHNGASYNETSEATFFREDTLPDDLSVGRVTRVQLERFFHLYRNPHLPADYD